MHDETLDHLLIIELTATPPASFAAEQMGVALESHWLGGRWMFGRWEIADIAFFIILRQNGHLLSRKVALLQTKRLYSKEIDVAELEEADYRMGIGRLVDRTEPTFPISRQRAFSFDADCLYAAMSAGDKQIEWIERYGALSGIPVYYGFYDPTAIPLGALYPLLGGVGEGGPNVIGMRVMTASHVQNVLSKMTQSRPPTFSCMSRTGSSDTVDYGWRTENFIADEVLRCREGKIFDEVDDPNLSNLLYRRSAPIAAAVTITIDLGGRD